MKPKPTPKRPSIASASLSNPAARPFVVSGFGRRGGGRKAAVCSLGAKRGGVSTQTQKERERESPSREPQTDKRNTHAGKRTDGVAERAPPQADAEALGVGARLPGEEPQARGEDAGAVGQLRVEEAQQRPRGARDLKAPRGVESRVERCTPCGGGGARERRRLFFYDVCV